MAEATARLLPASTDQYDELVGWVLDALPARAGLLEVGAGNGDVDYHARLRPHLDRYVGVDPDPGIAGNAWLDEAHRSTMEAWVPAGGSATFDAALAVYVVEHVADPVAFLAAVRARLSPGASFFLVTPNLWHYFGLTARATAALGVDEWLLRRLRGDATTDEYHFPVRYRCNSVRALRRHGAAAGFRTVEIRAMEDPGVFQPYFPPRWRTLPERWSRLAYRMGRPELLGTLLARLT
jgi:SAM-dependent methyltransferase